MKGYGPATYGEGFADVYDDWYRDVSDVDATVVGVRKLSEGGPILELGVGTGRLAIPLAAIGESVVGLDASTAMLDRLSNKGGGAAVKCVQADMAELPFAAGSFSLAFAAFNTFFNLPDTASQQACLNTLAGVLRPHGRLVIEGFVPPAEGMNDGGLSIREISLDAAVVTMSTHDSESQQIRGQHVEFSTAGIRMRPWMISYRTPDQLDADAACCGFALEARWANWAEREFTPDSESHVSVYRLAAAGPD